MAEATLGLSQGRHRGAPPSLLLASLRSDARYLKRLKEALPKIIVLGTGSLDPLIVEILELLELASSEVKVHVILPSMDYLGDLFNKKALPPANTDAEELEIAGPHPLLVSMARHSVGSFLLLGKLDPDYQQWPEQFPRQKTLNANLLQTLQADLRARRTPSKIQIGAEDLSILFHSCYGARREMEALRDEIHRAFQDFPDLKPEDVHIIAPSLEKYAPLVAAILEQGDNPLRIQLTERPPSECAPVAAALLQLLDMMVDGRFEASQLLELIQLKSVRDRFGINEDDSALERLKDWIRKSGMTHGIESATCENEPGTWMFAQDRLLAGRFLGGIEDATYPSGSYVLPLADQLGGDSDLRESFLCWLHALALTLKEWANPTTAMDWAKRLSQATRDLLASEEEGLGVIGTPLSFLANQSCVELLDAGTIFDWLSGEVASSARRAHLDGKIRFGAIRHLQSIPCRVLCMVGMQNGAFPSESRVPAWDLLRAEPRLWDRNARIDDRQLFLDALMTPTDRLVITASTRSNRTKKDIPFSACVDEVLRVIELMDSESPAPIIKHRLQPFFPDYFKEGGDVPRSFDSRMAEVVKELRPLSERVVLPFWKGEDESPTQNFASDEISLSELISFWKDPAKAYVRAQGITLPYDAKSDTDLDRAPIAIDALGKWGINNSILNEFITGGDNSERIQALLSAERGLPLKELGRSLWDQACITTIPLAESVRDHMGERTPVSILEPDLNVSVAGEVLKHKDGSSLIASGVGKMDKPKHFLDAFIKTVVMGALGKPSATLLYNQTNPTDPLRLAEIPQQESKTLLNLLVQGFIEGRSTPLCYAPSTSEQMLNSLEGKSFRSQWDKTYPPGQGEGETEAAKLVWRDRDPFVSLESWSKWFLISETLKEWRNGVSIGE